jgi:hypothetical protein
MAGWRGVQATIVPGQWFEWHVSHAALRHRIPMLLPCDTASDSFAAFFGARDNAIKDMA